MARRFGAAPRGQVLAGLVLVASALMAAGHLDATATFDIFFWTLATWLMVLLLTSPEPAGEWRLWLILGLVMGVALENKTLAIFLDASLAGGVLLTRRWEIVRSPGLWAAMAIAIAIWAPNAIWQTLNGFPQLQMASHIAAGNQGLADRINQIVILMFDAGPLVFPVFLGGLVWLLRAPEAKAWRALGIAALLDAALTFATAGKNYYMAGFVPLLIAGGAVPLDRWLGRSRLKWSAFLPTLAVSGAALAVLTLPLIPVSSLHSTLIPHLYPDSVAQVGWPQLAAQVEQVVDGLPASDRAHAVIVTAAYGQYGPLTLYGKNLPPIYSGHNSVWYWGRPADGAGPVILVGKWGVPPPSVFTGCAAVGTVDNGYDLPSEEQGTPIWVCNGTNVPWSQAWPLLKHID